MTAFGYETDVPKTLKLVKGKPRFFFFTGVVAGTVVLMSSLYLCSDTMLPMDRSDKILIML